MRTRASLISCGALVLVIVGFLAFRPERPAPAPTFPKDEESEDVATHSLPANETLRVSIGEEILTGYADKNRPPLHDLQLVDRLLLSYRTLVKNHSSKPVGTNADFVDAWCGDNPARLQLLPRNFPHLSEDGELLDRWGSPLFFHPEAADRVTLRSAGPDRKLWNEDDLVFPAEQRRGTVHE